MSSLRQASVNALPWKALNGAWLALFVNFGAAYGAVVIFPDVQKEFQMPSWHLGAIFSTSGFLYYSLGLLTGRFIDRNGVRPFVIAGQFVMAAGFWFASVAHNELQFATAYIGAIGIGLGISYTPLTAVGPLYCSHRAATASSIVISGIGVGTLIVPATCSLLAQIVGWRDTIATLGGFALVAILGSLPLKPVHGATRKSSARGSAGSTSTRRCFWQLYAALTLSAIVVFVPFAHIIPYVQSLGWPLSNGALLIGLVGLGSLVGRLGLGLVGEKIGSCRATSFCLAGVCLSFLVFSMTTIFWPIVCAAILFGIAYGGFSSLTAPAAIEALGHEGISETLGRLNTSRAVGIMIGPWSIGLLARSNAGYQTAFMFCALVAFVASFLLLPLQRPPTEDRLDVPSSPGPEPI